MKWFGSSIDIEDRKCAERKIAEKTSELEQREFYLREGERLAHMGSWSLRPDGNFDYWSPETFAIFGFDPAKGIPNYSRWEALPQGRSPSSPQIRERKNAHGISAVRVSWLLPPSLDGFLLR